MLRANVGISKKLSRDFNSRGFSLNLDAELNATLDDHEAVIRRIRELYAIAEEALDQQTAESEEIDAIAHRECEERPRPHRNGETNGTAHPRPDATATGRNGNGDRRRATGEAATSKQLQFLQNLARRHKMLGPDLETFVEQVVGHPRSVRDLTKNEAGKVIDQLSGEEAGSPSRR
jgi:hypothetical protein